MKGIERKLRSQHWYSRLTRWLKGEGIEWEVETGGKHPALTAQLPDGTELRRTIPCTPRTSRSAAEDICGMRRQIADRQREPERVSKSAWTPERIACLTRGVNPLAPGTPRTPGG